MKIGWKVKDGHLQGVVCKVEEMTANVILENPEGQIITRLLQDLTVVSETWPAYGPDFNRWYGDFTIFTRLISNISPNRWVRHSQFKYVDIYTDIRSNSFKLKDRDGKDADPIALLNALTE